MMISNQIFLLQDDGFFVESFNFEQQVLIMTQDKEEAHPFKLLDALEVVRRLGWLASKRLLVKAVDGVVKL
jgi:hypothetical protein